MDHAIYRTMDPRARILHGISEELAERTGNRKWFDLSEISGLCTHIYIRTYRGTEIEHGER
ncbi:MAG: citrate/2-methylcitrate synthase [Candidatus Methanoperedens sp.]|nr:citrate/2-methylcitrate synthase [Candidatus Methanoperedens sp.]